MFQLNQWFHSTTQNLTFNLSLVREIYWDLKPEEGDSFTRIVFVCDLNEAVGEPWLRITNHDDRLALRKMICGDDGWKP